jgi:DNA-binding response OmpR family regulator
MRVLLLEDDKDVADTVTTVMTSFFPNTEVVHLVDGGDFRKGLWRTAKWDLVVMDLMMPGVTGFEACEAIRANRSTATVPVLALTGYDTLQNEERIKAAGATGYMAKPFEVPTLLAEIKRILGKKHGL